LTPLTIGQENHLKNRHKYRHPVSKGLLAQQLIQDDSDTLSIYRLFSGIPMSNTRTSIFCALLALFSSAASAGTQFYLYGPASVENNTDNTFYAGISTFVIYPENYQPYFTSFETDYSINWTNTTTNSEHGSLNFSSNEHDMGSPFSLSFATAGNYSINATAATRASSFGQIIEYQPNEFGEIDRYSATFRSYTFTTNTNTFASMYVNVTAPAPASPAITPTPAPVPEPETYAMMIAGLGVLGFMARRRQKI
jgi:PEP-CTERM motif